MTVWKSARGNRKPPKVARTLPVKGLGDDAGRYYRCWNCGFVCKVGRDALGGPESRSGNVVAEAVVYNDLGAAFDGEPESGLVTLSAFGSGPMDLILPLASADGDVQTPVHVMTETAASGCPACGTLNWRGDYP